MTATSTATIVNGLVLGWSVAWPPGPINAEMIRRALTPRAEGGGFWSAWQLGLGACTGDFMWALGVAAGAGALLASPRLHLILGVVSFLLLLFLAFNFARGAWHAWRAANVGGACVPRPDRGAKAAPTLSRGYLLGLILALTSPWNIGFWFAVVGGQGAAQRNAGFLSSLVLAVAVVSGAIAWTIVLCTALKLGARIFARPAWQIGTQAVSALVMLAFAARLVWLWR
ncbi:MAG: LysE family translocator [Verrucomicrobiota bacterium]|nr:LysE family transporter [Chthoniobacterales bacterium]MDQ3414891.1 LysE family translocator [Verrucomicrobiota bacterium]